MDTSSDEQRIRDVIADYADGMRTHDVKTLKRAFHHLAILCGYLGDDLIAGPIAALYDWVEANPGPAATGDPYRCEILRIEITGRTHVGVGSDLDGAFGTEQCPLDVDSIADLARLRPILASRGYSPADIEAVMAGNFIRFLREAWRS